MQIKTDEDMRSLGREIATKLTGGMCVELIGDVGAGKTTLVQGIGEGLEADDVVQSPSFTISREYDCRDGLRLVHYDFYRLQDAGILSYELDESLTDPHAITIIEWATTIDAVLPSTRVQIRIEMMPDDESREVTIEGMSL